MLIRPYFMHMQGTIRARTLFKGGLRRWSGAHSHKAKATKFADFYNALLDSREDMNDEISLVLLVFVLLCMVVRRAAS
jgi:hypothetical protein